MKYAPTDRLTQSLTVIKNILKTDLRAFAQGASKVVGGTGLSEQ